MKPGEILSEFFYQKVGNFFIDKQETGLQNRPGAVSFVGPPKKPRSGVVPFVPCSQKPRSGVVPFVGPPEKPRSGVVSFGTNRRPGPETGTGPGGLTCGIYHRKTKSRLRECDFGYPLYFVPVFWDL